VADLGDLTDLEQRFVREHLKDLRGAAAARRAGVPYNSARSWACRKLAEPRIAACIEQLKALHLQRLDVEVSDLVDRLARIVKADIGEIMEYRRGCCHHCWGKDHRYQRTDGALRAARVRHEQALKKARAEGRDLVDDIPLEFDEEGGGGFNATLDPHPDCPECHGEGVGVPFFKDTRELGPNAAAAFAGVKMTKDGVEIKTHDTVKALELLGRMKGAFTENVNVKGHVTVQQLASRMRNRRPLA
jgi:phage terminase small subunit